MKRITTITVALLFLVGAALPAFAQATQHKKSEVAMEVTHGTVVSIEAATKTLVVKDAKTGQDKTFTVSEKVALSVKAGEKVVIKVKAGSTVAESVRVVKTAAKKK